VAQTVRLTGVPVDLYLEASRHMTEVVREFALISFGDRSGASERVPARLLALVEDLGQLYKSDTDAIGAQVEAAAAAGAATTDIEFLADETAVEMTESITELLDAADEFCRSGYLLTLASSPDVVAWRHWWRDEVVRQVREGAEPSQFA
jgi:hypothetical protein